MLKQLLYTAAFYAVSSLAIFIATKIGPNGHEGGLGLGGIVMMLFPVVCLVLAGLNIYLGIKSENYYFIIAAIHAVVALGLVYFLFL